VQGKFRSTAPISIVFLKRKAPFSIEVGVCQPSTLAQLLLTKTDFSRRFVAVAEPALLLAGGHGQRLDADAAQAGAEGASGAGPGGR
jgi:hypothetical protein